MYAWIFGFGLLFAFYNAWGIGANDCANSFATSVGAKVLTLKQAVLVAAVFEFCGAVFMGSHVTSTVRKKIVDLDLFQDNPGALMYGMLCADLSSAIWLTVATYFKLPVSTTHSIIGAIVGFSLAYGGKDAVNWDKIWLVISSWVASPFIAGVIAMFLFFTINKLVFQRPHAFENTQKIFPVITFFTFFINCLFIIYKGSPQLDLDETPLWLAIVSSIGVGLVTALGAQFIYLPYAKRTIGKEAEDSQDTELESTTNTSENNDSGSNPELQNSESYREAVEGASSEDTCKNFTFDPTLKMEDNIAKSKELVKILENEKYETEIEKLHVHSDKIEARSEKLCSWIQIITACFSSFAHGSNDVANAVAPLATIYHIYQYNEIEKKSDVPIWVLVLGGVGIVIGLGTWGYKIIGRIGRELTKISPSRGFIIELSAALTIIIASRSEIPVSTTHCQVGSVVGCGLVGGVKNVQWHILKKIVYSWIVTLPITGLLSAGLFSYGYYSPNDGDKIMDEIVSSGLNMTSGY